MPILSCTPARDINFTSPAASPEVKHHSMKNMTFHSSLRWKMIILHTNSHYIIYTFHFKRLRGCSFWTFGCERVRNNQVTIPQIYLRNGQQSITQHWANKTTDQQTLYQTSLPRPHPVEECLWLWVAFVLTRKENSLWRDRTHHWQAEVGDIQCRRIWPSCYRPTALCTVQCPSYLGPSFWS